MKKTRKIGKQYIFLSNKQNQKQHKEIAYIQMERITSRIHTLYGFVFSLNNINDSPCTCPHVWWALLCYICIHSLLFGSKISAEFTSFYSFQFSFPQTDQKPSSSVLPRLRCNSQNTVTTTKKNPTIYFCSELLVWLPIELNSIHVKQIKQKKKVGSRILDYVQQ